MTKQNKPVLTLNEMGLCFSDTEANMGVRDLGLRLTIEGKKINVRYKILETDGCGLAAEGAAGNKDLSVRTTAHAISALNAVVLEHRITNSSMRPAFINEAATGQFSESSAVLHGRGSLLGWDLRFCHTDNVRTERYPHCQMEYPYVRMLPTATVRLGQGEDQAFPGLWISDQQGKNGIIFAAASQALNYTVFELCKRALVNTSIFEHFAILHDPGQNSGFVVPAGGELALDGVFIQLTGDIVPEDAFAGYIDFVSERFKFRGPQTPLLSQAFHCTWNYGVFGDQRETSLLPTAHFITANMPDIKWFLMDAGYLQGDSNVTFLERFYPDPNQHVSADKWPRGIRAYTDELRRLGLRPGLWWSPTIRVPSLLYDEHPDWFLRNADGSLYLIGDENAFLDYSNEQALAYLDRTLGVILGDWGMDACKMDFWSQNFEDHHVRLQNPSRTAVEVRKRFFETIRNHLPEDGVLMTCVATGMGNPFIAQYADTYRNTIDIGVGQWDEQVRNCIWALPTLGFEGRKTFLLNNDSVGILADYPDNENYFRLTWGFINMGMIETGGRMETWPEKWVSAMRKLTGRCDRGHKCLCPDDRAFTGVPLPEVLYVNYPENSPTRRAGVRQSVALFNWTDEPRIISVKRSRLNQTGTIRAENFWTTEREIFEGDFIYKRMEKRSALLFDIFEWK